MTYKELHELTHQWAYDRKLVVNGNVETQILKLLSEFGELADGIIKNRPHEIKDAIGDMMVVLSNIASIDGYERCNFLDYCELKSVQDLDICINCFIYNLAIDIGHLNDGFYNARYIIQALKHIAAKYNFSLVECWESAYNEIKDRKGYVNEQGNFIKEGDV